MRIIRISLRLPSLRFLSRMSISELRISCALENSNNSFFYFFNA